MSLDPKKSVQIETHNLWPTPLWICNLAKNTRQERKVSLNDDLISYIKGDIETNPKSAQKSNRGGWQSTPDLHKKGIVDELGQDIYSVCKAIFPHIKKMKVEQMWAAVNFKDNWNSLHCHGGHYCLSGAYYLQVPENSGRLALRDPRPGAINNVWSSFMIDKGDYSWYTPKESDLMLWPPFLDHMVEPSNSDDPRIMISFDLNFNV
tara:strand:+ start:2374 stop:2991 length:618 start_codon:yes stop_codon:yes gene_type:complete